MRLSIWPQFSSNHSAGFTLVGAFETPEQAKQAAAQLNHDLNSICDWFRRPENEELRASIEGEAITPATAVEAEIAEKYGVVWKYTLLDDWLQFYDGDAVEQFDNFIFLESGRCWMPPDPVDMIVVQLGGEVAVDGNRRIDTIEYDNGLYLDESTRVEGRVETQMSFQARDAAAAGEIVRLFQQYFEWAGTQRRSGFRLPSGDIQRVLANSSTQGEVERDELQITLTVRMSNVKSGLRGLISYLKKMDCTGFEYQLGQSPELES